LFDLAANAKFLLRITLPLAATKLTRLWNQAIVIVIQSEQAPEVARK